VGSEIRPGGSYRNTRTLIVGSLLELDGRASLDELFLERLGLFFGTASLTALGAASTRSLASFSRARDFAHDLMIWIFLAGSAIPSA